MLFFFFYEPLPIRERGPRALAAALNIALRSFCPASAPAYRYYTYRRMPHMLNPATDLRTERARRDRDLVRRTALLLSKNLPLDQVFGQLSIVLSAFVDAPIVVICSAIDGEPRVEYALIDGEAGIPSDPSIPAGSVTHRVLASGRPMLFCTERDWPAQVLMDVNGRTQVPQSAVFVPIVFGGAPWAY